VLEWSSDLMSDRLGNCLSDRPEFGETSGINPVATPSQADEKSSGVCRDYGGWT